MRFSQRHSSQVLRRLSAAVVLLVVLVTAGGVVLGCGGDTASDSASGGETIKVGVVTALSGSIAADGQGLLAAAKLWSGEVNDNGGLLGRQIELIVEDDASDPKSCNEKTKAVLGRGAEVVIGPILTAERTASQPTVTAAGVPFLYPTFYEGGAFDPLMFIAGEVPEQQTEKFVPYLVDKYGPKVYFLGSDYDFPRVANEKAKEYLEAAGGQVVGEEYVALGTTDFSSVITRIAKAKPDVLFCDVVGTDGIALSKQFFDYGLADATTFASIVHMESYITAIGPEASENTVVSFGYFENLKSPANDAFIEGFKAIESTVPATTITARSYVLLKMWAAAVEKADSTDGEAVKTAMEGLAITGTPLGDVTMRATDHHMAAHMYVAEAHSGQFEVVQDLGLIEPGADQRTQK